ncbi:hypothetical protein ACFWGR_09810 [Streptomyces sp. NPDC060311]|uniref:hypothetical protein n=1 Tax=Streptomyces TaxID=1883 RepID=UPI0028527438|nr:hypothetical protein [Streptomyces salinarius]
MAGSSVHSVSHARASSGAGGRAAGDQVERVLKPTGGHGAEVVVDFVGEGAHP